LSDCGNFSKVPPHFDRSLLVYIFFEAPLMPRARVGLMAIAAMVFAVSHGTLAHAQMPVTVMPPQSMTPSEVVYDPAVMVNPAEPSPPCPPLYDPYVVTQQQPLVPRWDPYHIGVYGEFLYLTARNVDVSYAVPQDGLLIAGAAPMGPVAVVSPDYSPGFRVGGFFTMGPDARLSGTYTWFNSSSSNSVSTDGTNVLNPLVLFPGTFNAGSTAQTASASYDVDYQLIDIDYEVIAERCDHYWFGGSVGARYAQLEQTFNVTFPFDPPDGTTTLNTSANFHGVGPRAGLNGERCLFAGSGLRAYGKTSASFLVGHYSTSYQQTNEFAGTQANTSLAQDRIVPLLDLELGLAWLSQGQRIRLSGGYLISAWFNSVTNPGWIASVQNGTYNPSSETVTFDGLTARAEVRF
jgi:hypothetical protein